MKILMRRLIKSRLIWIFSLQMYVRIYPLSEVTWLLPYMYYINQLDRRQ